MLSDERLRDIKARAAAASPGPWYHDRGQVWWRNDGPDSCPKCIMLPGVHTHSPYHWKLAQMSVHSADFRDARSNASFTAHARQDIPDLVAEVERLRAGLAWYADRSNYYQSIGEDGGSNLYHEDSDVQEDEGQYARDVLAGKQSAAV